MYLDDIAASVRLWLMCTGKQYMYLDDIATSVRLHREAAQQVYMGPSLAFTSLQTSIQDYASKFHTQVDIKFAVHCNFS